MYEKKKVSFYSNNKKIKTIIKENICIDEKRKVMNIIYTKYDKVNNTVLNSICIKIKKENMYCIKIIEDDNIMEELSLNKNDTIKILERYNDFAINGIKLIKEDKL